MRTFRLKVNVNYLSPKINIAFFLMLIIGYIIIWLNIETDALMIIPFAILMLGILVIILELTLESEIKVEDSHLYFKWLGAEKIVSEIVSFKLITREDAFIPLLKADPIQLPIYLIMAIWFVVSTFPVIITITYYLVIIEIVILSLLIVSAFLPARIGYKMFLSLYFGLAGLFFGVLLKKLGPILLSSLLLFCVFSLIGFLFSVKIKPRYLNLVVKARVDDELSTIVFSGKKDEILRFKEALVEVMKNVEVA